MSTKMKAIILAAGKGTRLYPLTLEKPKCLLEIGGKSVIDRQIEVIRKMGIENIVVVVGYKKEVIKKEIGDAVRYREYLDFEKTNNLHTLWSVRDELDCEFICFFADIVFDTDLIRKAMESTKDICMICDTQRVLEGTMRIKLTDKKITGVGDHIPASEGSGNFLGIAKFTKQGADMLLDQMEKMISGHKNDYYTMAIDALAKKGVEIGYVNLNESLWVEVDTMEDLDNARQLLANRKVKKMSSKTFRYKDIRMEAYKSACSRRPYLNYWSKNPYTCLKVRFYLEFSSIVIYFLLRTNINPNSVTIAYGLAGVLGGILLAIPNTTTILIALFLFFSKGILDWSDGHIARATNQTSLTGHILDVYGAYLNSLGLQIGLGFYVAAKSNLVLFYYLIPLIPFFYATGLINYAKQLLFDEAIKKRREQVTPPTTSVNSVADTIKDDDANKSIVDRFRFLTGILDDRARSVDFILLLILIEVFFPSVFVTWIIFTILVAKALIIFLGKFYLVIKKNWVENNAL